MEWEAGSAHLDRQAQSRESKQEVGQDFKLSKSTPSGTLPSSRTHSLSFPKWQHQHGTKCWSAQDCRQATWLGLWKGNRWWCWGMVRVLIARGTGQPKFQYSPALGRDWRLPRWGPPAFSPLHCHPSATQQCGSSYLILEVSTLRICWKHNSICFAMGNRFSCKSILHNSRLNRNRLLSLMLSSYRTFIILCHVSSP